MTTIIVATTRNHAIGRGGDMLYHISADLRRFRQLTMGRPIIMGRRTFESFPKGALPGRRNIVVTRNRDYSAPGIETAPSLDEALTMAAGADPFIIGGGDIYRQALDRADAVELTLIDAEASDADTFFPALDADDWAETSHSEPQTDGGVTFSYIRLERRPRALMVLSGGMDSVTMLHEYRRHIGGAVYFNYGSNHAARESECARLHCRQLGVELIEIPLDFMGRYFKSSLLSGAGAIPDADYAHENLVSTVVPFRNGIMLAVACGLAESRGLDRVMIANHAGDHEIYPDCRPGFIAAMGSAMSEGTYAPVRLFAPYTSLDKTDIALRGLRMGIDYSTTYSCYRGGAEPCGRCATCREREAALAAAAKRMTSRG